MVQEDCGSQVKISDERKENKDDRTIWICTCQYKRTE